MNIDSQFRSEAIFWIACCIIAFTLGLVIGAIDLEREHQHQLLKSAEDCERKDLTPVFIRVEDQYAIKCKEEFQ